MWIIKPDWVIHGENKPMPIISVDIDPHLERIATGCMDNSIGIWKLVCITEDISEEDDEPQLALLKQHCGQVNSVRWCPSGQFLASGSDDNLIIIWQLGNSGLSDNIEDWRPMSTLRFHTADVKELTWNKKGSLLASGSIDNTIAVWNIEAHQSFPLTVLKGHTSFISSLALDPMDKHLLSLGEDRKLIQWCVQTWKPLAEKDLNLDHEVTHSLKKADVTSDGLHIVVPGPRKQPFKYMACVFNTQEMELEKYLIGHFAPISVIRCSPTLYESPEGPAALLQSVLMTVQFLCGNGANLLQLS